MTKLPSHKFNRYLIYAVLISISIYFLNATSYIQSLRYGKYLWLVTLPLVFLALTVNRLKFNKSFFMQEITPWIPIFLSGAVLFIIHGNFSGSNILGKLFILLMAFSLLVSHVKLNTKILFWVNAINCLLLTCLGWIQVSFLGFQVPGQDVNQNIFAGVIVLLGGFSCLSSFHNNQASQLSPTDRAIFFIIGTISVITAILTGCRTVFLTLIVLLPLLAYSFIRFTNISKSKRFIIGLVLIIVVINFTLITNNDLLTQRIGKIIPEIVQWQSQQENVVSTSIGIRLSMYQIAIFDIFPKFPFFGMGDLSGEEIANILNIKSIVQSHINNWTHFHNDVLQMLVTGGLCFVMSASFVFLLLLKKALGNPLLLWLLGCGAMFGLTEIFFFRQNTFICFCTLWLFYQATQLQEDINAN